MSDLAGAVTLQAQGATLEDLLPLGRVEQALRELRVTEEIDPLSRQTHSLLGVALSSAGRFDEAFSHCQKGAANDQQRSGCWAENLQYQGKNEEAVGILEPVWTAHLMEPGAQVVGAAYAKAGRRQGPQGGCRWPAGRSRRTGA